MSNKYSDQLMQALDIAIDEKISTLQFDKTIQATVQSVVDLDTGEYRVKYKDGIISAFAADPKETFKQGDAVYVTVPESDFSNKKFISHRITNNSLSTGQYTELANTIFEVSPNFSDLGYIYTSQPSNGYSLVVGENSSLNILQSAPALANSRFKAYADQYEYIQISASFYNEFTTDHEVGDYGIQLVLTNLDDKQVSYFLNLNDFNGDPYHLATWSPQSTVVKIPKGQIKALNAIYFYENGFISEGNKANLFMSDFSLNFVDKIDLTEVPYYLNILPLDGIAFTADQASLRLEGHVYHIGEELPETSCIFQWFERDLSVVPGDEAYDKRAGWGWRPIEEATNKLLTRTKTQVPWQKSYKLVAVYNSTTLMTKEITLINGSLDIEIEQVTSGNAIYLKLTKSGYTGDWYYLASDGNQVAIPQSPRSGTSPDIVPYLLYSPMTFYCQVYQGEIYQGELNYVMQNIESKDDVSVVFSGESLFSYDANGDINIYDAELERSLQAEIVWKKGIISSSPTIRWLDFENNVIGSEWVDYSNKDSMLKKVRVDTIENILYYTVKHKFKQTPSKNNSFRVEISTTDGQIYSFDKEIVFTKTGDPGTNGTRYQSLITITSSNRFVGVNSSNTTITLGCKVYKDQTEFSGATVSWTPVNLAIVSQSGANVSVKANNSNRKRYIKATITIVDEGKTTTLYDFYPVNSCASQPNIDLSELPKYIQYAANGRNPQFRKQVPTIKYNGATATIASGDTGIIKIANGQFKPIDEFNPDNPIGLLTVTVSGLTIYHPVPMYINTFGNEAINGWDGVSVDVDTEGGKILAPQVGAGTKDQSTNKFTGVVMGKDSAQQKVGLYGYQAGINSFGLTEEGKAYFGVAGKGRITIDGTSATISGGGGGTSTSGMTITLSAAASSADAIRVGNGNFIVTYGGKLTAKSAVIDGTITAGAGSVIGGWTLAAKRLYSGTGTSYVALDSGTANVNQAIWAGKADPATAPFRVTRAGALTATSADITGVIKATSGYIGGTSGWIIDSNKIYGAKNSNYVALSTQGNYALFAGASSSDDTGGANAPFWVKFDGSLQATAATIQGKITAIEGAIGNWKINSSSDGALRSTLSDSGASTRIYLNGKPSSGGNVIEVKTSASSIVDNQVVATNGQFYVTDQGKMVATNAEIHGTIKSKAGELGGWTINSSGLKKADNIYFYSNGSLNVRDNLVVDTSGNVTVKGAITAKTGYLGWESDNNKGWIITGSRIYSNATNYVALASNGTYAIWAGNSTASSAPFSVTHTGKVIATDIEATGKITANTGKIAGWVISGNKLQVRTSATDTTGSTNLYLNGGPWANGESQYVIYMSASSPNDTGASNTNGKFYVTTGGHMFAQNAEIKGTITSKDGNIGGWTINSEGFKKADNIYIYSNGSLKLRDNFEVNAQGNVTVTGTINATSGYIGGSTSGWKIESNKISSNNGTGKYIELASNGTYAIIAGDSTATNAPFSVTHQGKLYANNAEINGKITATEGVIGNWKINSQNDGALRSSGSNQATRIYLDGAATNDGKVLFISSSASPSSDSSDYTTSANGYFYVTANGKMYAQAAEIKGTIKSKDGEIGGWTIDSNGFKKADNIYIYSNGSLKLKDNFQIDTQGNVTVTGTITAKEGYIGWQNNNNKGWIISANKIYSNASNYVALASNGSYAIWAGNETPTNAPFSVTHQGKITATQGRVAGWIISNNKLQVRTSASDDTGSTNLYLNGGPWESGQDQYVIYMSATTPSDTDSTAINGRFFVTTGGHMYAQSAEIKGTIYSKAGAIGTWNITNRAISTLTSETTVTTSGTTGMAKSGFTGYYDANGSGTYNNGDTLISNIAFWSGMKYVKEGDNYYLQGSQNGTFFAVTHGGKLYCRSADITGTITADSGTIGGWEIRNNRLENSTGTVYLSASGGLKLGDNFSVSTSGTLSANGATISGAISAGNNSRIGNWFIMNDRLQTETGSVYLGTNGFKLGSNFSVNSLGQLSASGATISGNITLGSGSTINWNNVSETGTVPYDEAGDAAAALRSAKDYTDDEIGSLDIPVLPDYIKSTKIYEARIESPTIVGGDIYAANFYAVNSSTSSYLNISSSGIKHINQVKNQFWEIYYDWQEPSQIGNMHISCTNGNIRLEPENRVYLPMSSYVYVGVANGGGLQNLDNYVDGRINASTIIARFG